MKTKITILLLLAGMLCQAQTNVTSILNAQLPGSPGELALGCCVDDGLNPDETNTDLCVFQNYVATLDVDLKRSKFTLRNSTLTFLNGANFYTNGAELVFTCDAQIIFEGGGQLIITEGANQTLGINQLPADHNLYPNNTNFSIYTIEGKELIKGNNVRQAVNKLIADRPKSTYIIKISGYKPVIKIL